MWLSQFSFVWHLHFQVVFSLCPLTITEWWAVLKISVPVILLDETLKFAARNFVDGNHPAKAVSHHHQLHSSSTSKELLILIFSWISYFVLLIATSKELISNAYLQSSLA